MQELSRIDGWAARRSGLDRSFSSLSWSIPDLFCLRNDRQVVDGPRRCVRCILGDCSRRNFEPKARQLRLDLPLTPKSIFRGHSADKGPKFHRNWVAAWPPCGAAWTPAPIRVPTLAVPAQHRYRPYNEERGLPAAEPATRQNPETSVHILKARPWLAALQDYQLLPETRLSARDRCGKPTHFPVGKADDIVEETGANTRWYRRGRGSSIQGKVLGITSGSCRGQQGLVTTCKNSSTEAKSRRRREPNGSGEW